jgi:hypothetical protein
MDIKAALAGMTRTDYARWIGQPDGWDQWVAGFTLDSNGPAPLMAGRIGTMIVTIADPDGATTLHPHDSVDQAQECFRNIAGAIERHSLMMDPRSSDYAGTEPAQPEQTLALPVSTDEPNARPFGWA